MSAAAERRARTLAERRAGQLRARIAAELDALPGVVAEAAGERVTIAGRSLEARRRSDPALRWIGGWLA